MKLDHPVKSVSLELLMYLNILFLFLSLPLLFTWTHLLSAASFMGDVLNPEVPRCVYVHGCLQRISALTHWLQRENYFVTEVRVMHHADIWISGTTGFSVWCEAGNTKWRDKAEKEGRRGSDRTKAAAALVQCMNICLWVLRVTGI